ncbi:efflux RND transporter periplasmic adaptor subunit [Rhodopseudomonas palustris]|uniref:Secretion protein HlyD n=1 Tax=Rhodopseudomonas palustris (strain BisB18) TaxID=316056 RepID=Q213U1_RHOPB
MTMREIALFGPAIVALALMVGGCDSALREPAKRDVAAAPLPVIVAPVRYQDGGRTRTFAATIRPAIESDLGFRVNGKVARRLVRNGDRVRKGQTLLELDPDDLQLQREQAEAEVKAATTSLSQAAADERRAIELQSKGWAANTTVEKALAAAQEARSRLIRAQRGLDLAAHSLDYATLAAEEDGVITATPVEPGQVITAAQPAVRLARLAELEALVALPESYVEHARQAAASLTLWSLPEQVYVVRLRELALAAEPATRTYAARFSIADPDEAVRIGMSATLMLREQGGRPVARLPLTALFNHGRGPSVWVVDAGGRLAERAVVIDRYDARFVLIVSGVTEGESVVALGVEKLDAGLTVRAVSALSF